MAEDNGEDYKMPDDPTANDAEWKRIQQNTFTRWCNEHLKCANLYIYDIEKDLSDGLKLVALLQVLSHKKIARYNKKPTFRPQKLENIAIALKFIEDEEIKLVNIDASDILKGNLKLILGLIWTLILKYQISLPMMDDDDEASNITPKQALMGWVKSKLPPELKVSNFNKDWNDGIAIASLVESSAPGLFPEWEDLLPENSLDNAREAMKRAEDWLGVPQVITPEEITNPNVDELSVMTYVSYFPEAKCKPGAPLKKKMTDASNCSASGPGLEEHGVVINKPADFTVFTSGSSRGKINVQVFGPGRKQIDCNVQDNHDNTYSCQYIPPKEGTYDVHIRVGGHHIPKSPFRVNVVSDLDASKVTAKGPGLEPHGVIVGRAAQFEVNASEAGSGDLLIDVIDPKGNKKTEIKVEEKPGNIFNCMYMPLLVGRYVIVIKYGGKEVAKSPYHVNVTPAAQRVKIYGPGLEPGLKTGKPATFTIDCTEAGDGGLDVSIEGPSRNDVKCELKDNGDGTFTCTYKPTKPGQYTIKVQFDNASVPRSPVKVSVGSTADPSKIKAWGPGLERGVEGRPAEFYVNLNKAPIDNLTVGVEGPGKAEVEIKDNGDGTVTCIYYPTKPGKYIIHIKYEDADIKDSPYQALISKHGKVEAVYAEGPGLNDGVMAGTPAKFTVFAKGAGVKGSVQVKAVDENGVTADCKVTDNNDGTFSVVYYPKTPGNYTITIYFMDEEIPKSPVRVKVMPFCDPSKVKATGPGLQGGKVMKPAQFKIDASQAGEGGIGLTIEGPTEAEIKCDDHGNGTCSVEYMPNESGDYKINVTFADQHIPGSPFTAVISDEFDASKVKADGPGLKPGNKTGKPCDIVIDTRKAGKAKLNVEVTDEVGEPVKVDLTEEEPGLFASSYFPEKEGTHTVNITYGGKPINKSPFKVKISPSSDASKVKVFGPGIKPTGVKSMEPTYFEIDTTDAGEGDVSVNIEPTDESLPRVKDMEVKEGKKPNTYVVTYIPPKDGEYVISVTFAGVQVPKSPFKIKVQPGCDASKVKVHGPGIEEPIVGQSNPFTVECPPEAGVGDLTCTIESPSGLKIRAKVTDNGDGTYSVEWTPKETGKHKLTIKYGPQEVPGSPFYIDVLDKPDPSKVKCYGPGLEHAFVGKPAEFTIETKKAGPGNLGLTIEGPEEAKIDCKDNGDGTCSVTYYPTQPGNYTVNVTFDDVHVPNSPFTVSCQEPVDASKVKCKGPGVSSSVPASLPATFTVDATKAGKAPLECEVDGPGGTKIPVDIKDNEDGTFEVTYLPDKKGRYSVSPKYGGQAVPGSPFCVSGEPCGDARKVTCSGPGLSRPHVGVPAPFECDTSKAGKGKLNASCKGPDGEDVPVKMVEDEDGIVACEYTPEQEGPHQLDVLFGGQPVKGSPFKANATPVPEVEKIKAPVLEELLEAGPCVDQQFEAPVDCSEVPDNKGAILTGRITTPSGKKEKVDVKDNRDGTFALNYTPKECGKYTLDVAYDGVAVPGSPFEFEVTEGGPDKVKVYGKGIKKGVVAVPSRFTVDTKNAGPGDLSVAVEGPSKVDIDCVDNGDGTCEVTYVPVEAGDYDVIVNFDNQPVPGSPFKPKVVQDEPAVEVGRPSDLCMLPEGVKGSDAPRLNGVLEAPSGKEKPVDVSEGPNDSILASFVPEEPGKNLLHVKKNNKEIDGSPIPVMVREAPVIGKESEIPLECTDCDLPKDLPKLKGVLTRPNGKEEPVKVEEAPDNTIACTFVPEEPGKHLLKVYKDDKQIDDSPFVIMVEGTPDQYPQVGKPCDKNFYQPEPCKRSDVSKMKGTLRRPTGKEEPVDVKLGPDGTIAVSFVPTEAGEHLVSVKKDGRHVPNSPFSIIVMDEAAVPTVGSDCAANFDIPELDLPKDLKDLTGTLTRPNGKEEPLELGVGPDNSLAVNFVPEEAGPHKIGVKKKGKHVKDSPFTIMVEEPKESTPSGPAVGKDCDVNLDIPELSLPRDLKNVEAELTRPTGKKEPLKCDVGPEDTLAVNFTPEENGKHLIDVKKRGRPVKGSPFVVMVGPADDEDDGAPGVGDQFDVDLEIPELTLPRDLRNVEAELQRPDGKKEPLKPKEGPDEHTLGVSFVPEQPGEHLIDVQKRGRPVAGSPFPVQVGPGKKKPVPIDEDIVPMVEQNVESGNMDFPDSAGDNRPKVGNPCGMNVDSNDINLPDDLDKLKAELTRPSGKKEPVKCALAPDNTLALEFIPEEPGEHSIDVKKRGRPIKGSPFKIMVDKADDTKGKPTVGAPCKTNVHSDDIKLPEDLDKLAAELKRPSGKKEPITCGMAPDGTLALEFTPKEPGLHEVIVKKNGRPIKGSPFKIMVDEAGPSKDKPTVGSPCQTSVKSDDINLPEDLDKLTAEITRPSGKKGPVKCGMAPDGSLTLEFIPEEPGEHSIVVKKNGRPIKGSPFVVMVEEPDSTSSKPRVGSPCDVNLEIDDVKLPEDLDKLKAELTRPSGKKEPVECTMAPDGTLLIGFVPEEVGKHLLDVKKNRRPVKGSPFEIMVEEALSPVSKPTVGNKCGVDFDIPDIELPKDLKDIKAKLSRPSGKVEEIPCQCSPENTLALEFTPTEPGKHMVDVTKRGRPVKGSPFEVMVDEEEPSTKAPTVGSECDVNLDIPGLNLPRDFKYLEGSLKRPNKRDEEPLKLVLKDNNTIGVSFIPEQPGTHVITIKKHGIHVSGSPFQVMVEPAPTQAQEPVVGVPVDLGLDMTISPDELKFMKGSLTRPNGQEEPLELKLSPEGQLIVTFTPKEQGLHKVNIKRRGKHVPGSPIEVMVGAGKKKPGYDVGFEIPGIRLPDDLKLLKGILVTPSGTEEPIELKAGPNNTIVVSFVPKEAGKHLIYIKKNGKDVGDSPYIVIVKPEDVTMGKPDASKVKCTGPGLRHGKPNKQANFTVDTRDAGYGGLGLSVEGPSKVEINCVDNEDGTCSVDFTPTEPGQYLINVTYADTHVPGSPFKCRVGDGAVDEDIIPVTEMGVQEESPDMFSDMLAFPSSKARSPQDFVIKFSGSGDLKASVTRPSGVEDDAEVVETGTDTYTVRFVPRETGEHLVNVKSRRRHIPGSPFKVLVEAPSGGAAACKASGPGLEGGICCQPCRFTVITRDAGPGGLAVAVEGPAKAEIQCHDNGDGSCDITWYPVEAGEYTIHIRFADEAIPGSPYKVNILPADEGEAMSMDKFKEQVLRVGQQASFAVQMKGRTGTISASVNSPSGQNIECSVAELDEGNYAVRFVPCELGDHLVSVFLDGLHIPGSPFTVKVGGLEGDPSKVVAYGPGLKGGVAGLPAEFTVNALDAGSGALALSIDGPAKVKMNCVEQDDGTYKVIYNPTLAGVYEISIRFAGQHIPGSAYKVRIVESEDQLDAAMMLGDASKCSATGDGLKSARIGKPAEFKVDASRAGRGSIMVGVEGPEIPAQEIIVRHTGGNVYSVNYVLLESGDYILKVLWADCHIPGSPFHVTV